MTWAEFGERFGELDWDEDPDQVIAPGGESWTGFVNRAADMLMTVADRHPGELVVVACHAGVIEASLLGLFPVAADGRGHGCSCGPSTPRSPPGRSTTAVGGCWATTTSAHLVAGALWASPGKAGSATGDRRGVAQQA